MKAIVRAAKAARERSHEFLEADVRFQKLMEQRYGEHDRPDSIVEVVDYANGMNVEITVEWLDAQMAEEGIFPNKEVDRDE